jgi:hypothetical protein
MHLRRFCQPYVQKKVVVFQHPVRIRKEKLSPSFADDDLEIPPLPYEPKRNSWLCVTSAASKLGED